MTFKLESLCRACIAYQKKQRFFGSCLNIMLSNGRNEPAGSADGLQPASAPGAEASPEYEWLFTAGPPPGQGYSSVYRNKLQLPIRNGDITAERDDEREIHFSTSRDGLLTLHPKISTSWSLFESTAQSKPDQDFVGFRPIQVKILSLQLVKPSAYPLGYLHSHPTSVVTLGRPVLNLSH